MKSRKRAGLVALAIFGLPWAALSVAAFVQTVSYIQSQNWHSVMSELIAAALLGLIGFGILGAVIIQWKPMTETDRLRAAHPDQQWLWRSDWAAGRVDDSNRRKMRLLWLFSILWTVLSSPFLFFVPKDVIMNHDYPALLVLVFPAASIGWIFLALKATKRWRKFGQSSFVMSNAPCSVGKGVAGAVEFQKSFQTDAEFHLELTCIRRVRKKGTDGKTRTDVDDIWSDKKNARLDARGTVPVEFQLPANARETDMRTNDKQITWQLNIEAPVAGAGYKALFEVPVFKI